MDKVPVQDGFSLSADPSLPAAASLNWSSAVAPHSSVLLPITWRPNAAGSVSRLLVFKLDDKHRLQVKLLGKAVMQFNQPSGRQTDQSSRASGLHGTDAAGKKALTSSSTGAQHKQAVPPSAATQPKAPQQQSGPAAGARPASGSSTARSSGVAPPARFKAPARSSAAGSLKLKPQAPPSGQAAAGAKAAPAAAKRPASAAAPARTQSAATRPSPWQEAASGAGGAVVPATPRGSRIGAQPAPASTPVSAASKGSKGLGLTSSSQKAPSSSRKTFRFFHTE
jgi:hypothetical protein